MTFIFYSERVDRKERRIVDASATFTMKPTTSFGGSKLKPSNFAPIGRVPSPGYFDPELEGPGGSKVDLAKTNALIANSSENAILTDGRDVTPTPSDPFPQPEVQ